MRVSIHPILGGGLLLASLFSAPVRGDGPRPLPTSAAEAFARAAEAYQSIPALTDTLTLSVAMPDMEAVERVIRYAFVEQSASVEMERFVGFVADGESIRAYRVGVDDLYFESPIEGDLGRTLMRVRGPLKVPGLMEPPQQALREGGEISRVLDALRLTPYLEPLAIGTLARLADGRLEVSLTASNGECRVRLDPQTMLLESIESRFHPSDAPPGYEVRISGRFSPRAASTGATIPRVRVEGRTRVDRPNKLEASPPGITGSATEVLPPDNLRDGTRSVDEVAAAVQEKRVILIGETHRANETLAWTMELLDRLDDRPLHLLLELPSGVQPLLDAYLASGERETLDRLFAQDVLPLRPLVEWAWANRDRVTSVRAIDEDQWLIDLRRDLASDTRNDTMARAIHSAYAASTDARVVAYCGQMHALLAGRYRFDEPSREPAGARILQLGVPREDVVSILMEGAGRFPLHESWTDPGALHVSGTTADLPFPWFVDYPIFGVTRAGELFDWFVNLGPLTRVGE